MSTAAAGAAVSGGPGQMSGQVWRESPGEYQADERAGVARLSWRVSGNIQELKP